MPLDVFQLNYVMRHIIEIEVGRYLDSLEAKGDDVFYFQFDGDDSTQILSVLKSRTLIDLNCCSSSFFIRMKDRKSKLLVCSKNLSRKSFVKNIQ